MVVGESEVVGLEAGFWLGCGLDDSKGGKIGRGTCREVWGLCWK